MINVWKKCSPLLTKISKKDDWFLLIAFTIVAIFFRGYSYGVGDQAYYLTFVNAKLNSSLYPSDYLIRTHTVNGTIYIDFITAIYSHIRSREEFVFGLYILLLYFFYLSIFTLSMTIFRNRSAAWLAVFFLIIPLPIAGSGIETFEKTLIMRVVGDVCLLIAIVCMLRKRYFFSGLTAGIGFLFHPLTLLSYPLLVFFYFKFQSIQLRNIISIFLPFAAFGIWMTINYLKMSPHEGLIMSREWMNVVITRMPYAFALHWSISSWIVSFVYASFYLFFLVFFHKSLRFHPILQASLVSSMIFFLANIASEVFRFHLGLQLQLTRALYLPILFSIVLFSYTTLRLGRTFTILVYVIYIALSLTRREKIYIYGKIYPESLDVVALWAKNNTLLSSIFSIPPSHSGFRFVSERSVVTEYKEGSESLYSSIFAKEWFNRQRILEDYYSMTFSRIGLLRKKYNVDFLVTSQFLPFPVVYRTNDWVVYDLRGFSEL